jgi:hypothetical protein
MRRHTTRLAVLAMLAGILAVAAPMAAAHAQPASQVGPGAAATVWLRSTRAALEAQGFQADPAALLDTVHTDGLWQGHKGWYNGANGRTYYMKISIGVDHNVTTQQWRGFADLWCTRKYGTTEVTQPCNYETTFYALAGATNADSDMTGIASKYVHLTCQSGGITITGTWRSYGVLWVQAYVQNWSVRFVNSTDCSSIHLTAQYDVGSLAVKPTSEAEAFNGRTGNSAFTYGTGT